MKKQTLPRQSSHIVDLLTILWEIFSKRSDKKNRKLVLLVLRQTKIQIVQLENALDAAPKIILLLNVQNHLKMEKRKTERKASKSRQDSLGISIISILDIFFVFKTYFLSVFLFYVLRWLQTISDKMIYGAKSKTFPMRTIRIFVR